MNIDEERQQAAAILEGMRRWFRDGRGGSFMSKTEEESQQVMGRDRRQAQRQHTVQYHDEDAMRCLADLTFWASH